ncbi:hypothetical protein OG500_30455 [Kitasatospora sp. NBC_01250]|uniref:hypothetical protein n=1 Tax=unclassified Kitasatospora TaxID=2633591 RepID=UPI002E14750C|nr:MULTISPECIES: hypothetical protein [unclassified Kitasatospora]WSJ70347.1 hypothetical protein OG294_31970 [Kitasatospora sp. NBC_01302]
MTGTWVLMGAVGLATAGLLVLGVLGMRLWLDVRSLAKQVDGAAQALTGAAEELGESVESVRR